MPTKPLLVARNLCYTPPGADAPVLGDISIEIAPGDLVDVTGPSGAGKTTLLRAFARLLPNTSCELALDGVPAAEIPPREWRARVALLPQITALRAGTIRENLLLPWTLAARAADSRPGDAALQAALAGIGLGDLALDRDAARLSVGQAARISLLRVVLTEPEVLLLDEPDANLDDDSAAQVAALTERFVSGGGAVVRVRHLRRDGAATRRVRIEGGVLQEVTLS